VSRSPTSFVPIRSTNSSHALKNCASREELVRLLKAHYQAAREVRRGVCLLNAGQYVEAATAFANAGNSGSTDASLPAYLAAALLGLGKPDAAAAKLAQTAETPKASSADKIRHALALRAAGEQREAIQSLHDTVRRHPNDAEVHFQLGTLLAAAGQYDEAELRFTQAINLDTNHAEARVSLALCCGVRGATAAALKHLQLAQGQRPHDARLGFLLSQAAKALHDHGEAVRVRAAMPPAETALDPRGIDELSRVIEAEPDFVDAFLSLSDGQVDHAVFAMLLRTIETALERQPEHAELHFHCGRVLERLGQREAAIDANERAVVINPKFTRALIELGRLYQKTDRNADAMTRLEQAVAAGAEYADVYLLLGNLYREQGQVQQARTAYRKALTINHGYEAAREALAALSG